MRKKDVWDSLHGYRVCTLDKGLGGPLQRLGEWIQREVRWAAEAGRDGSSLHRDEGGSSATVGIGRFHEPSTLLLRRRRQSASLFRRDRRRDHERPQIGLIRESMNQGRCGRRRDRVASEVDLVRMRVSLACEREVRQRERELGDGLVFQRSRRGLRTGRGRRDGRGRRARRHDRAPVGRRRRARRRLRSPRLDSRRLGRVRDAG